MEIDPRILKPFDKKAYALETFGLYKKYKTDDDRIIDFFYDDWAYYVRIFDKDFNQIVFDAFNHPYEDLDLEIAKWLENEKNPVLIYKR